MPRLEAVLGCALTELNWDHLQRLVDEKMQEDLSLEFKAKLYLLGKADVDKKGPFELAKDVTAFANSSGGLIIIGISDKDGAASGFASIDPHENDCRKLHNTYATGPYRSSAISISGSPATRTQIQDLPRKVAC